VDGRTYAFAVFVICSCANFEQVSGTEQARISSSPSEITMKLDRLSGFRSSNISC